MAEQPISARWIRLAVEARSIAGQLGDTELARILLKTGALYENIATRAQLSEGRERHHQETLRHVVSCRI